MTNITLSSAQMLALQSEIFRLERWKDDLLSGMWVNCVYCGHRYGPSESHPVAMATVLKEHIEICPKHPLSKLLANYRLIEEYAKHKPDCVWPVPRHGQLRFACSCGLSKLFLP